MIMTAGLALEAAVYDALGWSHSHIAQATGDADVLVPWQEPGPLTWLTYATRTGGGAVGGLLVGAGYYRFGPWRGTALLLVVALPRSEEHTSELQSRGQLVCRLLLEKKND